MQRANDDGEFDARENERNVNTVGCKRSGAPMPHFYRLIT